MTFFVVCKKKSDISTYKSASYLQINTLAQIIQNSFDFSLFSVALVKSGLMDSLNHSENFTVFAPTNEAFAVAGIKDSLQIKNMNQDSLIKLVKYHILNQKVVLFNQVSPRLNNVYINWAGFPLYLSRPANPANAAFSSPVSGVLLPADVLTVNGNISDTVHRDVIASNGVIHILNSPLKYPYQTNLTYIQQDTTLSLFYQLLQNYKLQNQVSNAKVPVTILAVSNAIFRKYKINASNIMSYVAPAYDSLIIKPYILMNQRFFTSDLLDYGNSYSTNSYFNNAIAFLYTDPSQVYTVQIGNISNPIGNGSTLPWAISLFLLDPTTQTYVQLGYNAQLSNSYGNRDIITSDGIIQKITNILYE